MKTLQQIAEEVSADCRTVMEACEAAGLSTEMVSAMLTFYQGHGLERTLFYISLRPENRCSLCELPVSVCRCDEPIPFLPRSRVEAEAFFND